MTEPTQQPRAPREWIELITVTRPSTPVAVRVQTTASGRPLYSMEIGVLRDGRMLRHVPVYTQLDGAAPTTDVEALASMIKEAEAAVAADAKRKADEWAARQPARDARGRDSRDDRRGRKDRGRERRERDDEDGRRWR